MKTTTAAFRALPVAQCSLERKLPPVLPRRSINMDDRTICEEIAIPDQSSTATTTVITASNCSSSSKGVHEVRFAPADFYSCHQLLLNPHSAKAHLYDLDDDVNSNVSSKSQKCWKALYEKYHTHSFVQIRPSGNPIDSGGFIKMFCGNDIIMIGFDIVRIEDVKILAQGMVAVVTYTVDQKFIFKGDLREDRVVYTCVTEEVEGTIRIQHEQRSSGQP